MRVRPPLIWLCVAFPCPVKGASWWLSRARGSFGPFGAPRAVRDSPVSGEKGILVVEPSPGIVTPFGAPGARSGFTAQRPRLVCSGILQGLYRKFCLEAAGVGGHLRALDLFSDLNPLIANTRPSYCTTAHARRLVVVAALVTENEMLSLVNSCYSVKEAL
ncbi:hypothetical protein HPB47_019379 [Ixodes persulcatus]|uniref:Uncharacterized protein n=1 Tax=Ixodes persulcatus TaxID=34615 RepID=A0AC60QLY0_IXOPE|nr:hypothetical protein HPB47_019379 [Ixodes persulcatus]